MPIPFAFDFKNPDYVSVFKWRIERLERLRKNPQELPILKAYYKNNIAQFIIDWGVTVDPRNVRRGLPAIIPFVLFERQEEFVHWFIERWKKSESGISDKSREMGVSWITIAIACSLCLLFDNMIIGFGSRKEEYVDRIGSPKSLFHKARQFTQFLPKEFKGNWDERRHAPFMRIFYPITGSRIVGESGDNMGRGDRTSIFITDEAAWLPRPQIVEAALSETTDCRIDVSTPHGMSNPFAKKRHSGKISVFSMHWTQDPRKDTEWYNKRCLQIDDDVVIAQELDLSYLASLEGQVLPEKWLTATIDAHAKLKIKPTGRRYGALDVADEGNDANAFGGCHGILLEFLHEWSGRGSDLYKTTEKAVDFCQLYNYRSFKYDAGGLGAGVRGDAHQINLKRKENKLPKIKTIPFIAHGEIWRPEEKVFPAENGAEEISDTSPTNEDYFENFKAQACFLFRKRIRATYRAVVENAEYNPDDIISISSDIPNYRNLIIELCQYTWDKSKNGKMLINKKPNGAKSPNLADCVIMLYAPDLKPSRGFFDLDDEDEQTDEYAPTFENFF